MSKNDPKYMASMNYFMVLTNASLGRRHVFKNATQAVTLTVHNFRRTKGTDWFTARLYVFAFATVLLFYGLIFLRLLGRKEGTTVDEETPIPV